MDNKTCRYKGMTPLDNYICNRCSLFLVTCKPIADADGYAQSSECDGYLCERCMHFECELMDLGGGCNNV